MHVFGLTGGIASGKSTVAARLAARGVPVVDADSLSRDVVVLGSEALSLIVSIFGSHVLAPDGSLDRKKLGAEVFGDATKLERLNAIMHPRIAALSAKKTAELAARGEPLACYEAALLVENGLADAFRPLVVVAAPLEAQIARARARDDMDQAAIIARITAQKPQEDKLRVADIVIQNDGSREDLMARADAALSEVCRRVGVDSARYASYHPQS
jgi:dephospho-CoA kinase